MVTPKPPKPPGCEILKADAESVQFATERNESSSGLAELSINLAVPTPGRLQINGPPSLLKQLPVASVPEVVMQPTLYICYLY
jgi:hypothetical protein